MQRRMVVVLAAVVGLLAACTQQPEVPRQEDPAAYEDREKVAFTATNGMRSTYHVYADGVPRRAGLLVWLHGDGAYEFRHPDSDYVMGGPDGVRRLAKEEGYVVVSARAPDRSGTVTWWERGADNADYLADLIGHLQQTYDTDPDDVVLAGFSGGAQQITRFFLPEHSGMLEGGGSIVFGGGGAPATPDERPWNEELIPRFRMHWATGEYDDAEHSDEDYDAIGEARAGLSYYTALGFESSAEWLPGKGHVIDGLFGEIVGEQLRLSREASGGR